MAKERILIGLELKEFLDCIRKNGRIIGNDSENEIKEKIHVAVPARAQCECCNCYVLAYCLDTSNKTLQKTTLTEKSWCINFTDTYGQYYSTLAPLLRICLLETDPNEKSWEISKTESILDELFKKAVRMEFLDEMNDVIKNNYNKSFQEILKQAQEVLDSYKDFV